MQYLYTHVNPDNKWKHLEKQVVDISDNNENNKEDNNNIKDDDNNVN